MAKLCKQIEKKRERENPNKIRYESLFNYFPWLTTLLSTIARPVILLLLGSTFGPCIFNKIVNLVNSRSETAHLMMMKTEYESLGAVEVEDYLDLSRKELQRFSEQNDK